MPRRCLRKDVSSPLPSSLVHTAFREIISEKGPFDGLPAGEEAFFAPEAVFS
jgi:hypothetical protein